jgi:hypothetical protein
VFQNGLSKDVILFSQRSIEALPGIKFPMSTVKLSSNPDESNAPTGL